MKTLLRLAIPAAFAALSFSTVARADTLFQLAEAKYEASRTAGVDEIKTFISAGNLDCKSVSFCTSSSCKPNEWQPSVLAKPVVWRLGDDVVGFSDVVLFELTQEFATKYATKELKTEQLPGAPVLTTVRMRYDGNDYETTSRFRMIGTDQLISYTLTLTNNRLPVEDVTVCDRSK